MVCCSARDITTNVVYFGGRCMGKGDKRTKKGKIFSGSHGKTRPTAKNKRVAKKQAKK